MSDETRSLSLDAEPAQRWLTQPHLFVALQCDRPLQRALRIRLRELDEVRIGRTAELAADLDGRVLHLGLPDERVSSAHCVLRRSGQGFVLVDEGSKNGTRKNGQPVKSAPLDDGDLLEVGKTLLIHQRVSAAPSGPAVVAVDAAQGAPGLCTLLPQLEAELGKLAAVATSRLPVLVRGESGTGKELTAAAVHSLSRRAGPFVPINCGALPPQLVASELFGSKKGAFSGAEERAGLVRAADRGTLFLDEIGDLHLDAQAALLRVLQDGEVLPLGATRPLQVDARIVAATHRDLEAMVAAGDFRQDLFARLSFHTVRLLPLRERLCDLGLLLAGILKTRLPERAAQIALKPSGARTLFSHAWPLNVRELERVVLGAAALSPEALLDVRAALDADRPRAAVAAGDEADLKARLEALLRAHKGNISAVAAEMGKARMQIQRWLKRFELDADSFRA